MIVASFRIQLPEDVWIAELSTEFSRSTFRLLSGYRTGETALELGETITDRPDDVVEAMGAHPAIDIHELLESDERRTLLKYETTDIALYDFVEASGLTIEFPIEVRDGWYEFDLTGTREEFDRLRELLENSPLSYELLSLARSTTPEELLTRRQRELINTAVRMGYFEVPRECTLAEIADELEIDTSTASTILRRGQARIVKSYLSGSTSSKSK